MATLKTEIIKSIFEDTSRWQGPSLIRPVVTLAEVQKAIETANSLPSAEPLSSRNPANFFKDFIRNITNANLNWPKEVLAAGYTGVQRTGQGNSFEFIALPQGQTTAFATCTTDYPRDKFAASYLVAQTLSLPAANKAWGRADENWIQSIAADLYLPQQHLSVYAKNLGLVEVGHIQSNIKLSKTEIDSLYYGRLANGDLVLIPLESKGQRDDVLETQILDQIEALKRLPAVQVLINSFNLTVAQTWIMPLVIKIVPASCCDPLATSFVPEGTNLLYLAHFDILPLVSPQSPSLSVAGETLFDLRPGIPGINA